MTTHTHRVIPERVMIATADALCPRCGRPITTGKDVIHLIRGEWLCPRHTTDNYRP